MTDAVSARPRYSPLIITIFFLLTIAVFTAGFFFYKFQKKQILGKEEVNLTSIADLKVGQIERWKKERMANAEFIFTRSFFAKEVGLWLKNRKDRILKEDIRLWMRSFKDIYHYDSVRLFDASGDEIISVAPQESQISDEAASLVKEGLAKKEVFFSDIELEKKTGVIHIHMVVPLIDAKDGKGALVGLLFIAINPQEFLFPLIQSWPVPTSSGETLLVKRVGNDILYLNDLRFAKDSAMKLTAPVDAKDLPAAMAVRGMEGFVSGVDYRNVPVYAAIRSISGFPWYLVAKIDRSEIDVPLRRRAFSVAAGMVLVILTAFMGMSLWWRRKEAEFYRRDITERTQAEKEILTAKTFLDRVMFLSPFPMWISDEKGLLLRGNRALLETLNVSEEQIVGQYNVLKDDNLSDQGVMPMVRDVFEKQKPARFMIPWKGARARGDFSGARDVIIDVSLFPIVDPDGHLTNAVCQWIDISDRVRAQKELVELNAELEQRVKDRTADLEEANRELVSFTYSVSHDLRAPLRSIDGFSNMLMEDCSKKLTEAEKNYLSRIHNAIAMMGELIDDMLALSKIGKTELHFAEVNLSEVANGIAKRLKEGEPGRNLKFVIAQGLSVKGDNTLLSAVMENLLENAWKFTSKHKEANIEFGARQEGGKRIFFIKDDGAGFDMAYVDKLFGPFQRLHTKEEFPGIGIGLASVKRIISRHGGRVWAEGAIEKGSTFYFTIP